MHTILKSGLAAAGAAVLVFPAFAQVDGGRPLSTTLTGAEETQAADEDGFGTFEARVNPGRGQVCYTLTAMDIETAFAAHIHVGESGTDGPPVVNLAVPCSGMSSGCEPVDRELAMELIRNPEGYYVNVHNAEFPAGAIRGQLSK